MLDRIGKGTREDDNQRRRLITLHSFRRFVKTTISDLGYDDYSQYFIGHSGSTYWHEKDSKSRNISKNRTILDIPKYLILENVYILTRRTPIK